MATLAAFSILCIWATMRSFLRRTSKDRYERFLASRFAVRAMMKPYGKWRVKSLDESRSKPIGAGHRDF